MNVRVGDLPSGPCRINASPVWVLPRWLCLAANYVPRVAIFCLDIMDGEEFPSTAVLFWAVAFLPVALVFGIHLVLP